MALRLMVMIATGLIPDDIDRCIDLWVDALRHRDGFADAHALAERMRHHFDSTVVRFALSGQPLAGFALTVARDDGSRTAVLERIAVRPQSAGLGIGRALLADAIGSAKAAGYVSLELAVRTGNTAVHLYEKAGFLPASVPVPHELGGQPMVTYRLGLR